MIGHTGVQAIKALLELSAEPDRWRSVSDLALAQNLPGPHLEQLLLRLRRAGVLEARRGRQGGYRLACTPAELTLNRVLEAVGSHPGRASREVCGTDVSDGEGDAATGQVAAMLQRRLIRAIARELEGLTLEELLYDLCSANAGLREEGGLILG